MLNMDLAHQEFPETFNECTTDGSVFSRIPERVW